MENDKEVIPIHKNHLLNLLNRKNYKENIDYFSIDSDGRYDSRSGSSDSETIDIDRIAGELRTSIKEKAYRDPQNILHRLNVKTNRAHNILTISVSNVSDNLRYSDPVLNRVLHQSRSIVFDARTYYPLFYLENRINSSDISPINRENSYLDRHLYSIMSEYRDGEFDHNKIRCYKNHIGSYIIIFYNNDRWMFYFDGKSYRLCIEKHAVLFEHIGAHLDSLNKDYCYHIVLVDPRLRIPLQSPVDSSYMVLIKINKKYTLHEYGIDHPTVPENLFVEDKRIYFSCLDQLDLYLEEMDNVNTRNKKLYNRGLIVKAKVDAYDPIHILYDTYTYKRLRDMMPKDMTMHEAHLHLYQTDRLNNVLQYVEDSDNAVLIVTRINLAIVTLGREVLDIYHFTRNKENPELFSLLSPAYRDLMHNLHGQFIEKKSRAVNKAVGRYEETEKVSISTEDVYITLKSMDTMALVDLFLDREILKEAIDQNRHKLDNQTVNIIKDCNSTSLQTSLLKR